jgi:AmmeMemoRadiSam system protein A
MRGYAVTKLLSTQDQLLLKTIAHNSIQHGLEYQGPLVPVLADYPPTLTQKGASFVTLTLHKQLRGCIGTLEAYQPLVQDVAHNAFESAFGDSRFSPLEASEFPAISIEISVLSAPEAVFFPTEQAWLDTVVPHEAGWILKDGPRRATFLPQVWEMLPKPADFLKHLKQKAGIEQHVWPKTYRYFCQHF